MNREDLKFASLCPFPHREDQALQRANSAVDALRTAEVTIPNPLLWDLLHAASTEAGRRGGRNHELESADAWHRWIRSRWHPLVVVSTDRSEAGPPRFPLQLIHQLALTLEATGHGRPTTVTEGDLRAWKWPGGVALRRLIDQDEDPMHTIGLATTLEHASGVLRADPFLTDSTTLSRRERNRTEIKGQRADANANTNLISHCGEFARREPSRLPDDPSRLTPMEHLYLDEVPDYFWQRAAENALVQRFDHRTQNSDRRMRAEIVIALHDDITLHRFEAGNRPPINEYRRFFASVTGTVLRVARAAAAELDLLVEYTGPISRSPQRARITPEIVASIENGDARTALVQISRLLPAFVSHHPTIDAPSPVIVRRPIVDFDRRARLQLGPPTAEVKRPFDEDEVIECVRNQDTSWQIRIRGGVTEMDAIDLETASKFAADRVLGVSDGIEWNSGRPSVEWNLA